MKLRNIMLAALTVLPMILASCATETIYYNEGPMASGLKWNDIEIDPTVDSRWSLSRSNSWVALTNYNEKSQIFLSWEGGMGDGEKENAVLKQSENGQAPLEYPLASLSMHNDGENLYINFTGQNDEAGSVKIPL